MMGWRWESPAFSAGPVEGSASAAKIGAIRAARLMTQGTTAGIPAAPDPQFVTREWRRLSRRGWTLQEVPQ